MKKLKVEGLLLIFYVKDAIGVEVVRKIKGEKKWMDESIRKR